MDVGTEVETEERKAFPVTLVNGTYTFLCDAHPSQMRGTFTVGEVAPPSTPPVTTPVTRLTLVVTSKTARLTTSAGKPVKALAAGRAVITVRDRSAVRGARLVGAGIRRSTTVKFVGTRTWTVKLSAGMLGYGSDPRQPVLKGGSVLVA